VAQRCRSRHLGPDELAALAYALTLRPPGKEALAALRAAAGQALWVYRRYRGGCRERRLREAAQLLVDIAQLRPVGHASGALAALAAAVALLLNGEPLPPPGELAGLAERACAEEVGPEEAAELLGRGEAKLGRAGKIGDAVAALRAAGYLAAILAARCPQPPHTGNY
jgi:hypothetical protein